MFDITDWMEVERESDPPASAPGPQSEPTGEKQFRIRSIFPDPNDEGCYFLKISKSRCKK